MRAGCSLLLRSSSSTTDVLNISLGDERRQDRPRGIHIALKSYGGDFRAFSVAFQYFADISQTIINLANFRPLYILRGDEGYTVSIACSQFLVYFLQLAFGIWKGSSVVTETFILIQRLDDKMSHS